MKLTKILAFFFAVVTLICLVSCSGNDGGLSCKVSVDCSAVSQQMDEKIAPKDGKYILPLTEVTFTQGDTLDEVLISAFKENKLHYEATDGYFTAVGNLYTGDFGDMSGWLYYVNGEIPEIGTKEYTVNNGDTIEFVYFDDYNKAFEN